LLAFSRGKLHNAHAGFALGIQQKEPPTVTIVVEEFHKNYERTVAVAGITFTVAAGEILGLVGPNGAGKTTTLRALAGILWPARDCRT
jgi:ABC-type uncharacterized transport system ATPase subunit